MRSRRELVHIEADLSQQAPGGHPVHSRNRLQPCDRLLERAHSAIDLRFDSCHFRALSRCGTEDVV